MFNGIIQTLLVAFSVRTFRACTDMLSSENDDFKLLKTGKNIKNMCITRTVLSLQTSLSLTRNINVKVAIKLYYRFSKISNFRYW